MWKIGRGVIRDGRVVDDIIVWKIGGDGEIER